MRCSKGGAISETLCTQPVVQEHSAAIAQTSQLSLPVSGFQAKQVTQAYVIETGLSRRAL